MTSGKDLIRLGISVAIGLLGVGHLAFWHLRPLHEAAIGSTRMANSTAVAFLCLSIALGALTARRRALVLVPSIAFGTIALLTLTEYASGIRVSIDQLYFVLFGPAPAQIARQMAPNTALSFLVVAVALWLLDSRTSTRRAASAACACVTTSIGFTSLTGYWTGLNTFEWAHFQPMALETSIGLTLAGMVVLLEAWINHRPRPGEWPPWAFLATGLTAAVLALSLWQALVVNETTHAQRAIASDLQALRDELASEMRLRIQGLVRVARRWEYGGQPRRQEWEFQAQLLQTDVEGYQSIAWVDPDFRIRWIAPRSGNEGLIGLSIANDRRSRDAALLARDSRQPAMTRPLSPGGWRGTRVYVPIYEREVLRGYIAGAFQFDNLFSELLKPGVSSRYDVAIDDAGERIHAAPLTAATRETAKWKQETTLPFNGSAWTVKIQPTQQLLNTLRSRLPETVFGAGMLLASLLAGACYLAQIANSRKQVAERVRGELEMEIAERRRVENELDRFFTLSPDLMCIADSEGRFTRLNPAWTLTLGYPIEALLQRAFIEFVHPDDREATLAKVTEQSAGKHVVGFENRYRTAGGDYRWIEWSSIEQPATGQIFAAARDVTARRQAEESLQRAHDELELRVVERTARLQSANQALREREELFRRLFEDSPIGSAVVGLDQTILRANKALGELLGYSPEELTKLSLLEITHPEDIDSTNAAFFSAFDGQTQPIKFSRRYLRKTAETVWVELTASMIQDEHGRTAAALVMVQDITQKRAHQSQITNLNHQLQGRVNELTEANKEIQAFTYSISHDLRAPLRHINGFAKILSEDYNANLSEGARHCLQRITQGAERMGRMVDELLQLSRTAKCEFHVQLTGLDSLVQEVIAELRPECADRDIEWQIKGLPFVYCDPVLMRQVFVNLLANAVKFTRPRSSAIVEVGQTEQDGGTVIYVRDNGVGFDMKYSDKLFGAFQRLHRQEDFEGTGVGLATVQRIIHRHGGRIWAEAETNRGATFYFTPGSSLEHDLPSPQEVLQVK